MSYNEDKQEVLSIAVLSGVILALHIVFTIIREGL